MRSLRTFAFLAAAYAALTAASAAETAYLTLKANGSDVQGDSTVASLGRANTIQCYSFELGITTAREAATGLATGRRQYSPIVIRKRIDKSSPLLAKALCNNEVIEGVFRFYRPNPAGDGTTQHFYTVNIRQGRVASVKNILPDVLNPATASHPPMEEVSFVFTNITWTYVPTGAEFTDTAGRVGGELAPLRIVRPPVEPSPKDRPKWTSAK